MSILLESLTQKEQSQRKQSQEDPVRQPPLPDIHSSHFDDAREEGMSEENNRTRQLKWWRVATFVLSFFLVASWMFFSYQFGRFSSLTTMSENSIEGRNSAISEHNTSAGNFSGNSNSGKLVLESSISDESDSNNNNSEDNHLSSTKKRSALLARESNTDLNRQSTKSELSENIVQKQVYIPKKYNDGAAKKIPISNTNTNSNTNSDVTNNKKSKRPKQVPSRENANDGVTNDSSSGLIVKAAIYKEQLPPEQLQKFPEFQVNSYVVADTPENSFVIMDGAFYKIDQVVAPNLILRKITNENIVVEFYNQLVKIPLN